MQIQNAEISHAADLAYLINLAGEGIPEYLWQDMTEGKETALDVGVRRARRSDGSFSYTNAKVCTDKDRLLGMIISYRQSDPYTLSDLEEYPEIVRPLVELEARSPGSWYVNALATYESDRGKGVARTLIADAERQARENHCSMISLIAASENLRARKLYEHLGFNVQGSLPMVQFPGSLLRGDWILMEKSLH